MKGTVAPSPNSSTADATWPTPTLSSDAIRWVILSMLASLIASRISVAPVHGAILGPAEELRRIAHTAPYCQRLSGDTLRLLVAASFAWLRLQLGHLIFEAYPNFGLQCRYTALK